MYYKWGSAEFLTSRPNITKSIHIRHPLVKSRFLAHAAG